MVTPGWNIGQRGIGGKRLRNTDVAVCLEYMLPIRGYLDTLRELGWGDCAPTTQDPKYTTLLVDPMNHPSGPPE